MYVRMYVSMCVYVYVCVCMHVCMYVCMYGGIFVCIYLYSMSMCVCSCTYIYIYREREREREREIEKKTDICIKSIHWYICFVGVLSGCSTSDVWNQNTNACLISHISWTCMHLVVKYHKNVTYTCAKIQRQHLKAAYSIKVQFLNSIHAYI